MKLCSLYKLVPILILSFIALNGRGQNFTNQDIRYLSTTNYLDIAPDARSYGTGLTGAATEPDGNSMFWNGAKMAFLPDSTRFGFAVNHLPYLRTLVDDMSLSQFAGYFKLNEKSALSYSMRYFTAGTITFTDINGSVLFDRSPREYSLDLGYSRKINSKLSLGFTARYFRMTPESLAYNSSLAIDLSLFRKSNLFQIKEKDAHFSYGLVLSNMGGKLVNENFQSLETFLPANLRLGTALNIRFSETNRLALSLDANKSMVPTPPIFNPENGDVISGISSSGVSSFQAMLNSFVDAPGVVSSNNGDYTVEDGSKFKEELREVSLSFGIEFQALQFLSLRTGYFSQHQSKGNGSFVSTGIGLGYQAVNLDISYLASTTDQNPVANTIMFSLLVDIPKK